MPKDIILINEGINLQREYEKQQQLEALFYARQNTAILLNVHTKRNIKPKKLYKFPFEIEEGLAKDKLIEIFEAKQSYITNGKLRGYLDNNNALWDKEQNNIIGNLINGTIEYIN